jgi:hypothetical protein
MTVAGAIGGAVALGSVAGFTAGAAAVAAGASVVAAFGGVVVGVAATVGVAAAITALGIIQEVRYGVGRVFSKKKLNGRNTECPSGYKIVENDESRKLTQDFRERIIIKDPSKVKVQGILCPDYEVN